LILQKANEQWEVTLAAEQWKQRFRKDTDKQYAMLHCPFKLIYRLTSQQETENGT